MIVLFILLQGLIAWFMVINVQIQRFDSLSETPGIDYVAYYAAGQLVREGRGDEIYDVDAIAATQTAAIGAPLSRQEVQPYFNPPFVAAAFAPLTILEPAEFALVLTLVVVTVVILAGLGLERFIGIARRGQRLAFWVWYASSFTWITMAIDGQVSMLLVLGWLGFVWGQVTGRQGWSGAALALTLVKPQSAAIMLVILIVKRRWVTVRSLALVAVPLVLVSVAVSGPAVLIEYPRFVLSSTAWDGQGIFTDRMFGWNGWASTLPGIGPASQLIASGLSLMTLSAVAWAWRGEFSPQTPRFLLLIGLTITACLLINPHLYTYDLSLMLLVLGLACRVQFMESGSYGYWPFLAVATWALHQYGVIVLFGTGVNLLTPGMALVAVVLLKRLHDERQAPAIAELRAA